MLFLELWRWTRFDKIVFALFVLFVIFWNLGENKIGDVSAYSVFNRDQQHLVGEFRAEQFEAQLRGGRATASTQAYRGEEPADQRPIDVRQREWKQRPDQKEAADRARDEAEALRRKKQEDQEKREREIATAAGMDWDVNPDDYDIQVVDEGKSKK